MSELSFYWRKERGDFSFLDISSVEETFAKTFGHLITSDPADHQGRQKQASELQSIIDLSECIHIRDSRLSISLILQIATQTIAIPVLTGK